MVETRFFRFCCHISKVILSLVAWNPFKALPVCCRSFPQISFFCIIQKHAIQVVHDIAVNYTNNLFGFTMEHGMRRTQICQVTSLVWFRIYSQYVICRFFELLVIR